MNDLIRRQAAIDVIKKIFPADPMRNDYTRGITCGAALAAEFIKQLPSAEPEDGSDCPFHKRWGIECDDGYSVCAIVQRLKGEEDFNG